MLSDGNWAVKPRRAAADTKLWVRSQPPATAHAARNDGRGRAELTAHPRADNSWAAVSRSCSASGVGWRADQVPGVASGVTCLLGLVLLGSLPLAAAIMVALCGLAFGAVPVAWSTWLTRTVPDQAESAGGLLVAAIQLAIAVGAAAGGAIFDLLDEAYRDSLAGASARAAV
jgi:hypothetical protein